MYFESQKYKHVWWIDKYHEFATGWYFSDEAEQLNGPYVSEIKAYRALIKYCKYLDGEIK